MPKKTKYKLKDVPQNDFLPPIPENAGEPTDSPEERETKVRAAYENLRKDGINVSEAEIADAVQSNDLYEEQAYGAYFLSIEQKRRDAYEDFIERHPELEPTVDTHGTDAFQMNLAGTEAAEQENVEFFTRIHDPEGFRNYIGEQVEAIRNYKLSDVVELDEETLPQLLTNKEKYRALQTMLHAEQILQCADELGLGYNNDTVELCRYKSSIVSAVYGVAHDRLAAMAEEEHKYVDPESKSLKKYSGDPKQLETLEGDTPETKNLMLWAQAFGPEREAFRDSVFEANDLIVEQHAKMRPDNLEQVLLTGMQEKKLDGGQYEITFRHEGEEKTWIRRTPHRDYSRDGDTAANASELEAIRDEMKATMRFGDGSTQKFSEMFAALDALVERNKRLKDDRGKLLDGLGTQYAELMKKTEEYLRYKRGDIIRRDSDRGLRRFELASGLARVCDGGYRAANRENKEYQLFSAPAEQNEMEAANRWTESFLETLRNNGRDLDSRLTSLQIAGFTLYRSRDKEDGWIERTKSPFLTQEEAKSFNAHAFLNGQKKLTELSREDKLLLYRMAKEGQLVLRDPGMDDRQMRMIYCKNDGTAGLSDVADTIDVMTNTVADEAFPDAANRDHYKKQFANYFVTHSKALGIDSPLSDLEQAELKARLVWEAGIVNEATRHPEYYDTPEKANLRGKQYLESLYGDFADQNSDWVIYADESHKHPVGESHENAYNAILKAIGIGNPEDPDVADTPWEAIQNGQVRRADGSAFTVDPEHPWEVIDEIARTVLDDTNGGQDVYVYESEDAERPRVISSRGSAQGEIRLKRSVAEDVTDLRKKDTVMNRLDTIIRGIDQTGSSRTGNDSPQFLKMKRMAHQVQTALTNDASGESYRTNMKKLAAAADEYYFQKLDQSMNTRRSTRFGLAKELKNLCEAAEQERGVESLKTDSESLLEIIAAKTAKSIVNRMASKEDERGEQARLMLNDAADERNGRTAFRRYAESIRNTEEFRQMYEQPAMKGDPERYKAFLMKEAARGADDLARRLHDRLPEEPALSDPEKKEEIDSPMLNDLSLK